MTVQERIQESTFINGLKPDIKVEVRMMKPTGLSEVMKFAQNGMRTAKATMGAQGWAA